MTLIMYLIEIMFHQFLMNGIINTLGNFLNELIQGRLVWLGSTQLVILMHTQNWKDPIIFKINYYFYQPAILSISTWE